VTAGRGWIWAVFLAVVLVLLAIDMLVVNRRGRVLTVKEATRWSAVLIGTALLFGALVAFVGGATSALEYYAGYIIELSLSVDNLFVFILIFQYFAVPAEAQPKVLKFGVFDAMVMRGIMIGLGTIVIRQFSWVIYILGAVLAVTGIKMFHSEEIRIEPEANPLVRLAKRVIPLTRSYEGAKFFIRGMRRGWIATPLILVIMVVEWTDIMFAIDSIPAIFAVTNDPFIIYSSNIFAIIGLRAMYFVLADAMTKFVYLKPGVATILTFVGLKMVASAWIHIPIALSLLVIIGILTTSIVLSIRRNRIDATRIELDRVG
jgi:tellurite resistance protein TerC